MSDVRRWVHAVNELVECWSQLEGKIDELTKWVDASKSSDPGAQAGLSIDKLEEQLNLLKVNFKDKQALVDVMSGACKGKNASRRKSQVNMNVRRMTMLPVEEMRKLSQMVGIDDDTDVTVEAPAPEAAAPEEPKAEEAVVEATVVVPPAEAAPEEAK